VAALQFNVEHKFEEDNTKLEPKETSAIDSRGSEYMSVACSYEHVNKPRGSIKMGIC
jgi:hypothetical protein